jgi:hypothetical protein
VLSLLDFCKYGLTEHISRSKRGIEPAWQRGERRLRIDPMRI